MLYIALDKNRLKLLHSKKTLLGQQEVKFFEKTFEVNLIEKGEVTNVDILASAIKEATTTLDISSDKEVFLILPQESFRFLKADVPGDIAPSAIQGFVYDKARTTLSIDIDDYFSDYYIRESENQKHISFFAISYTSLDKYNDACKLLNLKLVSVLPETLAIFKLFEKTLRKDKKENILYISCSKDSLSGYVYDSSGLISDEKWSAKITKEDTLKDLVKEKVEKLKKKDIKLNRIILSGEASEKVRQDTFTKEVGAWTNPLKRIIPNFYDDYVKQLVLPGKEAFPILIYDACFGAFVFTAENKEFQMLKKPMKSKRNGPSLSLPKFSIAKRDILVFFLTLIVTFGGLMLYFNIGNLKLPALKLPSLIKPQPTAIPTVIPPSPTPAPKVDKTKLRIKVLNGGGVKGKATVVKNLLKDKGYQEILTDNADNFDYKETVIQAKKDQSAAASVVEQDLKDSVSPVKKEELPDKEAADIVIIIGSDFK